MAPGGLPDPVVDKIKDLNPTRMAESGSVLPFSRWNPVFRIDVFEKRGLENMNLIAHDGIMGSTLHRFDGDFGKLERFDRDPRAYPFRVGRREPRVLIIGSPCSWAFPPSR